MSISIQPLQEQELDIYATITQSAFVNGIGSVVLHGGAAANETTHANLVKSQKKVIQSDDTARFVKAVDVSTGEVMGIAKWQFYTEEQSPEQLDRTLHAPSPGDANYVAANVPILEHILGGRRKFMGTRPYIYLSVLATDPKFHRRGAGGKLVEWGVRQADALGLVAYLESSPEARPLYERWGFEVVKEVEFDMNQFGRPDLKDTVDVNRLMIRQPGAKP